ncbi:MAG: hypothetical protein ACWGN7_05775, partial [Thermodesulfovibrionales bacterium]
MGTSGFNGVKCCTGSCPVFLPLLCCALIFLVFVSGCSDGSSSDDALVYPYTPGEEPQGDATDVSGFAMEEAIALSSEPEGSLDGERAAKARILRLTYPVSGGFENALVVIYADSAGPEVWEFSGRRYNASDLFVTRSTDNGATWSRPVNISRMAHLSSKSVDHDGDPGTPAVPYYGDASKSVVFAKGKNIVVTWTSSYAQPLPRVPDEKQGSIVYKEAGLIEVPYSCLYAARSTDGGKSWSYPEQLTSGYRDAIQNVVKASG